jgi:hypothetical protein
MNAETDRDLTFEEEEHSRVDCSSSMIYRRNLRTSRRPSQRVCAVSAAPFYWPLRSSLNKRRKFSYVRASRISKEPPARLSQ